MIWATKVVLAVVAGGAVATGVGYGAFNYKYYSEAWKKQKRAEFLKNYNYNGEYDMIDF